MPQRFEEESDTTVNNMTDDSGYEERDMTPLVDDPDTQETSPYGPSTVIAALDQIQVLVERARAVPLSANIVLNKAELLDLVDQARDALPEDLVAADAVVADAEAVLVRADYAADSAINEANSKARSILDEARERADSIMSEARNDAERTLKRAEEESGLTQSRARTEAETLLEDARNQAERLVAADAITALATQRAKELMVNSRGEADRLREGADAYVANALGKTSELLNDLIRRTDAGLRAISERQGESTDISIDDN